MYNKMSELSQTASGYCPRSAVYVLHQLKMNVGHNRGSGFGFLADLVGAEPPTTFALVAANQARCPRCFIPCSVLQLLEGHPDPTHAHCWMGILTLHLHA